MKIEALKDHFEGKTIALVGNGPSLSMDDLAILKEKRILSYGVNKIFLAYRKTDWRPTFYSASDHAIIPSVVESLKLHSPEFIFLPESISLFLPEDLRSKKNTTFINHVSRSSPLYKREFSTEADKITFGGYTVLYFALQIVFYLGFRKVIMLGVDHNYSSAQFRQTSEVGHNGRLIVHESGSNHFDPDYFTKGTVITEHYPDETTQSFKMAYDVFKENNREIINCSRSTNLDVIPRRPLNEVL